MGKGNYFQFDFFHKTNPPKWVTLDNSKYIKIKAFHTIGKIYKKLKNPTSFLIVAGEDTDHGDLPWLVFSPASEKPLERFIKTEESGLHL